MNAADKLVIYFAWAVVFTALAATVHVPLERSRRRRALAANRAERIRQTHPPALVWSGRCLDRAEVLGYDHATGRVHLVVPVGRGQFEWLSLDMSRVALSASRPGAR
jgi:hypothetical protein